VGIGPFDLGDNTRQIDALLGSNSAAKE
jgi:hypothetical protein